MSVKIYKRSTVLRNQMVFILLSLFFLQVMSSLSFGVSSWNLSTFIDLLIKYRIIAGLGLLDLILIYNAKKSSRYIFVLFSGLIIFEGTRFFVQDFDKLILILNFMYILFSYYSYLFLTIELGEAIYIPGFYENDVGRKSEYNLGVDMETPLVKSQGHLSNWDDTSCFVSISDEKTVPKGPIKIKINFENKTFEQVGNVVSRYGHGVGIKFQNEFKDSLGWKDFYDIIHDRGYRPRFLK